jgi:uncharacterized cupin superfamily protein
MPTNTPNVLLRSEESDGVVAAIEVASPPGFRGPPLHRHAFDEAFYVLEGELTVPHTYANHSDGPARALIVCTPAGFEEASSHGHGPRLRAVR